MLGCLVTLSPLDPASGTRQTVRICSVNDSRVTGLGGIEWEPCVTKAPSIGVQFWNGDFEQGNDPAQVAFAFNLAQARRKYPVAVTSVWMGCPVEVRVGRVGEAYAQWPVRFLGKVTDYAGDAYPAMSLRAAVDIEPLRANVLTATYAGTTGVEGGPDLKNRLKPLALGRPRNVEPVLIDAINSVYQFSGYGPIEAVEALFERGSQFAPAVANHASYAMLVAASIAPGRWATCLAQGLVRLGAPAAGVITGDIRGHAVGGVAPRGAGALSILLANLGGLNSGLIGTSAFNALDAEGASNSDMMLSDQVTLIDAVRQLVLPCNWQVLVSNLGVLTALKPSLAPAPSLTLHAQGKSLPLVKSVVEQSVSLPYYRTTMAAQRNWRQQSADEIAFEAPLIDKGNYNPDETYREGNYVTLPDGSQWLYINPTPSAGHYPPVGTEGDAWWANMRGATEVDWVNVGNASGTKPQDNADVTSENTSKDTAAVNGVPSPEVLDRIAAVNDLATGIIADVDGLIATYGETASAAASASAAAQHEANSLTAEQNAEAARAGAEGAYTGAFTQAGNAETFRNQASTYAQNAEGAAGTASEQAGLAVTARQDAQTAAGAANTSAGTATAKADAAGQSASAAQTSQVRASSFALDAAGRATNNIVGRGSFDERGKGNWHSANEAQTYTVQDVGAGGFWIMQQVGRDAWEGDPVPGDWSNRWFRVSGNAAAFRGYVARAGLQLTMTDGSNQYYMVVVGGPYHGYQDFSGEFQLPANVAAARPWIISDGPNDATDHGVNWRRIRIEDTTAERRAQNYADAASTSFSSAEIKATEAGQYAQAASGSANTANVRADEAQTAASTANGAAAVATDKAAAASTSASLAASFSVGASNMLPNTDFASGKQGSTVPGWILDSNASASFVWGVDNADFTISGERYQGLLCLEQNGDRSGALVSDWVAVQPSQWVQASAWLAARQCFASLRIQWGGGDGSYLRQGAQSESVFAPFTGWLNLDGFKRVWAKDQVPGDARFMRFVLEKGPYLSNPNGFLSWAFMLRPMLALATAEQNAPSPYAPRGGGKGLTDASAKISTVEQVAASANEAVAQRVGNLETSVGGPGGLSARVTTTEQAAADLYSRSAGALYQNTVEVTGGRAQMSMYALNQNGQVVTGIDFVGQNFTFNGNVLINGSLTTEKVGPNQMTATSAMSQAGNLGAAFQLTHPPRNSESTLQITVSGVVDVPAGSSIRALGDLYIGGVLVAAGVRLGKNNQSNTYSLTRLWGGSNAPVTARLETSQDGSSPDGPGYVDCTIVITELKR